MGKKVYFTLALFASFTLLTACGKSSSNNTDSSSKSSVKKDSALDVAKMDVDSLFADSKHTKLLEGTTDETIDDVSDKVSALKKSSAKSKLEKDVKKAKELWPAFKASIAKSDSIAAAKKESKDTASSAKQASKKAKQAEKDSISESKQKESDEKQAAESKSQSESVERANSEYVASQSQSVATEKANSESKEAAKNNPAAYQTGITYDQVARTPDDYYGEKIFFSGRVVQVMESSSKSQIRLAVDGNYDNILLLNIKNNILNGSRILEDDLISVAGTSTGTATYESTMGGDITIPSMKVKIVQNKGTASDDYGY